MADPFSPVIHPPSFRPLVPIAARPPEPLPAAASKEDYFLHPMQDASPTMRLINLLQGKALHPRPSPRLAPSETFPAEGNPVCYEDFARILGDGRFASGSFSDVSVSASDKNDTPRPNCSVGSGSSTRDVSSNASGDPRPRVKFMCSLGGKILPRPSDGILRYVGGETRIISVDRHISYTDLMLKMTECYGQGLAMKYQLPDEDLDALISVSSDEDFENMMEEYDRLESSDGSTRLRVFLFSLDECDVAHFSDSGDPRISEQLYVDAVNGVMETGFQKQLDIVSTSSSHDLMGLEISDPWNTSQMPESVPAALLASPISQDLAVSMVQSVSTGVPGLPQQALTKTPSALSSAPSNLMQVRAVNKHSLTPGVTSLFLPDQFLEFCGHPYNGLPSDGSYPDLKSGDFANPSAAPQHDVLYRFPESGRFPDSRTQAQREMLSSLQDQVHLGEHRRVLNARVPRVDSHGRMSRDKLMQLQEQHTQFAIEPGSAVSRLDSFMPQADLQQLAVQQQQLQSSQLVWQKRPETHRMVDLAQQVASDSIHAQVQALQHRQWQGSYLHLPSAALEHETSAYRLMDQSQLQNDVFNEHAPSHKLLALKASEAQHFNGIPSSPTFQVGSAPPSSRVGLRDNTAIQIGGQQHLHVHQVSNGAGCADNRYGRRLDQNNDQISGGLLLTDSSPHYRERVILDEEHIAARQQASTPLVNRECIPQEQLSNYSNIKHEPLQGKCHISDELLRTVVAPYDGVSTFQDRPAFFQGRQEAEESQFLPHEQQNLMNPYKDVRLEFQEQMLQPGQQFSVNPPYQDRQIEGNWIQRNLYQDESREFIGGRSRTDNQELGADPVASSHAETLAVAANLPAMQPLEGSKGFLGLAGRDAGATAPKMDGYDPFDSSPFNITAGLPPSITGNAPTALRTMYVDASKAVHAAEIIEPDILPEQTAKGTGTANVTTFDNEMSVQLTASNAETNLSSSQTLSDDGATGIASTPLASSMTLSMPTMAIGSTGSLSTGKMADGQWNDDLDLDSVRSEFTGHSSGQAGHRSNENIDCKSALILENELSKPGSGGNRSMVEGAFDIPSKQELHSYKWVDGKSLIDDVTLVPPHILYAAEVNDVSPPASFPLAVASLSTGLDSFTFNKASLPGSSVSVVGPTPVSLVAETRNPSNCLASSAVNLNPFSLPTTISVSFLPEEIEGREEIASADKSDLMVATVLEATAYKRSLENASNQVGSHDDGKEDGEHGAENAAAALLQPTLYSFPTLSVQNWEKSLAQAEFEEQAVKENLPGGKSLNEVKLDTSTEKEVTLQEVKVDVEEDNDDPKIDKPSNSAAAAEAEAIARDLQVIKNSDLEELQELGSGTFGTVYHGKWRGTDVAIKRIKSSCFTGRLAEQERLIADFWREAYILGLLHHPNVVAFYGVVPDGPGGTLATVTEYMVNGSLKQVLQKKDRTIDRRKRFVLAMDAAFGMEYLHGKKIVHFDLKCDNLLVNMRDPQRPICKVGDLGLSKVKQQTMVSGGVRGTLPWMAPELLNGSTSMVSEKVDVFSFGIVMWELLTGEEPYANMHYGVIIGGILNNTLRPPIPRWCDPAWKFLMERCWSADPLERPSFTQIVAELRTMATSVHGRG